MSMYSRPEEVLQHFETLFDSQKGLLGLSFGALQDENLITEYPAIEIAIGPVSRQDHGTQQFQVIWTVNFWVYHANFESTHRGRAIEDMEIATNVVRYLHTPENRRLETEDGVPHLLTGSGRVTDRSEEHTSELQSPLNLVCRL